MGHLTGEIIAGCVLDEHLGSGAVGTVYSARHADSGKRVAIKLLHVDVEERPEFLQRFQREARLAYQLDHPHIVHVHTWGEEDGIHYVVMEWIDGQSLEDMIRHHTRLQWRVAFGIGRQIARALDHVHGLGLVHRDVKPANILVGRDGIARLADLGLVRQLFDAADEVGGRRVTLPGSAIGSPCYMAPEQIGDTAGVIPAADIYALGATLFHALTGQPPLMGESPPDVLRRVLHEEPRRASAFVGDIPKDVSDLLQRCLAKKPDDRPESVSVIRDQMSALLAEYSTERMARNEEK